MRRPSTADEHFFSTAEDERLDGNKNFVEQAALKHGAIHNSSAKNRNSFVRPKKFRQINLGRINKGDCPSVSHRFQTT